MNGVKSTGTARHAERPNGVPLKVVVVPVALRLHEELDTTVPIDIVPVRHLKCRGAFFADVVFEKQELVIVENPKRNFRFIGIFLRPIQAVEVIRTEG